jgi:hypothetical protein
MRFRHIAFAAVALALAPLAGCIPPTDPGGPKLPGNCVTRDTTVRCTFAYNGKDGSDGGPQQFVTPAGVRSVTIDAFGAQGGGGGGLGGHARGTFTVAPSTVLYIRVGGSPADGVGGGFNGGGAGSPSGGGASDVRIGGDTLANRVVVAGGGGGQGLYDFFFGVEEIKLPLAGGMGGGGNGGNGNCTFPPPATITLDECSNGGTATAGGSPGSSQCGGVLSQIALQAAKPGAPGIGGAGASITCGVAGSTAPIIATVEGAGGGGGWFGGGGSGSEASQIPAGEIIGGAGGGSGFVSPSATSPVNEAGMQSVNGTVFVSYTP